MRLLLFRKRAIDTLKTNQLSSGDAIRILEKLAVLLQKDPQKQKKLDPEEPRTASPAGYGAGSLDGKVRTATGKYLKFIAKRLHWALWEE